MTRFLPSRLGWLAATAILCSPGCAAPPTPELPPTPPMTIPGAGGMMSPGTAQPPAQYQAPNVSPPAAGQPSAPLAQPPVSLDQIQAGCPASIPASQAGTMLQPYPGNLQGAPGAFGGPSGNLGYGYGAIPSMQDYGVYQNLMYYPFGNCWVPYTLVNGYYYPYAYVPSFLPLWTGYSLYPILVVIGGSFWPYYLYSLNYLFGYPDWEYNWGDFRDRHHDYDWDHERDRRHRDRDESNFDSWRDRTSGHDGDRQGGGDAATPPRGDGDRQERGDATTSSRGDGDRHERGDATPPSRGHGDRAGKKQGDSQVSPNPNPRKEKAGSSSKPKAKNADRTRGGNDKARGRHVNGQEEDTPEDITEE